MTELQAQQGSQRGRSADRQPLEILTRAQLDVLLSLLVTGTRYPAGDEWRLRVPDQPISRMSRCETRLCEALSMPIHNWWDGDATECYWMEITGRKDLGADLKAPQTDPSGRENWSYNLMTYVRPGDRVLHWHTSLLGEPAIVGWSEAVGPLSTISMSWQARGTRGRARGVPTTGPAWQLPLRNFTRLDPPVTRTFVNAWRARILEIQSGLEASVGKPIYAPFQCVQA